MKRCSLNARSEEQSGYSPLRSDSLRSLQARAVKDHLVARLSSCLPLW